METIRKVAIFAMVIVVGLGLVWTYGATIGSAATLALAFVMFEYIARNDD